MNRLEEIEAIKQLKYKYFRCLDGKDWDGMAECLTEDVSAAYDEGKFSYEGRDALLTFLRESLGDPKVVSLHNGHHPEIDVVDDENATGRWYLEDYLIFTENNFRLRGAAFYSDEYKKVDGRWRIRKTGYVRSFEETHDGSTDGVWTVTQSAAHLGKV